MCFPIVKFLTGKDYDTKPKEAFKAKPQKMIGADGKSVTAMNNIIFSDLLTEEEIRAVCDRPDLN